MRALYMPGGDFIPEGKKMEEVKNVEEAMQAEIPVDYRLEILIHHLGNILSKHYKDEIALEDCDTPSNYHERQALKKTIEVLEVVRRHGK